MQRNPISRYRPTKERRQKLAQTLEQFPGGIPRPEYPRPHFVRDAWLNLNGVWEFSFDEYNHGLIQRWQDRGPLPDFILVPFAPQVEMSCKNEKDLFDIAWYARTFEIPTHWRSDDTHILLHFGAVDYRCTVWLNGQEIGSNQGGHVPFNFDITPYLKKGANRVVVRAEDPQDAHQPRGKQSVRGIPKSVDYYCTTGIWQTVWLEPVPVIRIQDLRITPQLGQDPAEDGIEVRVFLHAPASGWDVEVEAIDTAEDGTETVVSMASDRSAGASAHLFLRMGNMRRWSPADPHLYDLRVRLRRGSMLLDEVRSYAGMRSVRIRDGRLLINGEPIYLKMVLDQGYWPESGMTAPSDAAFREDIEWCLKFGFNGARKHQKVEDPRWLYWCDRMGLLVWGEMANARAWSTVSEEWFVAEWERAVRRDYCHPCIITWVPINESWGVPGLQERNFAQYSFMERVVAQTRRLDTERPVVSNDGWEQAGITDILGIHDYTPDLKGIRRRYRSACRGGGLPRLAGASNRAIFARDTPYYGQPIILTEVGGFLSTPDTPEDEWDPLYSAYGTHKTAEDLYRMYKDLMTGLSELPFLVGFCYTQLTDVEQEKNGLLTYDRKPKIAPERIAEIHQQFGAVQLKALAKWRREFLDKGIASTALTGIGGA